MEPCADDRDCPPPACGDAIPLCVDGCILLCADEAECPDGMACDHNPDFGFSMCHW